MNECTSIGYGVGEKHPKLRYTIHNTHIIEQSKSGKREGEIVEEEDKFHDRLGVEKSKEIKRRVDT